MRFKSAAEIARTMAVPFAHNVGRVRKDWRESFEKFMEETLVPLADRHDADVAAVIGNPELSEVGRAAAVHKVKSAVMPALAQLRARTAGTLRSEAAGIVNELVGRTAFRKPTDQAERIGYEMRALEFRRAVGAMDALQRLNLYFGVTDPEQLSYFEDAPAVLDQVPAPRALYKGQRALAPFVDGDHVTRARAARVRAAHPERAEESDAMLALAAVYDQVLSNVEAAVREGIIDEAGLQAAGAARKAAADDDPIARMARTGSAG